MTDDDLERVASGTQKAPSAIIEVDVLGRGGGGGFSYLREHGAHASRAGVTGHLQGLLGCDRERDDQAATDPQDPPTFTLQTQAPRARRGSLRPSG